MHHTHPADFQCPGPLAHPSPACWRRCQAAGRGLWRGCSAGPWLSARGGGPLGGSRQTWGGSSSSSSSRLSWGLATALQDAGCSSWANPRRGHWVGCVSVYVGGTGGWGGRGGGGGTCASGHLVVHAACEPFEGAHQVWGHRQGPSPRPQAKDQEAVLHWEGRRSARGLWTGIGKLGSTSRVRSHAHPQCPVLLQ